MCRRFCYSLLTHLVLSGSSVFSQTLPEQLIFEHVYVPGTIRSSEISDVLQDPEGLIWIAADGLFQYDGLNFTRYTLLPDSGSIAGREINSLFYDHQRKRLLIATRNNGVVEYSYNTNALRKLPAQAGIPIVNELAQTPDGIIWGTTFNNGLYFLENDTLKRYYSDHYNTNTATSLCNDGDELIIGDVRKIFWIKDRKITDSLKLSWKDAEFTIYGRVTALAIDSARRLYMGTEKQGLLIYDLPSKTFIKYFSPEINPFYNRINKIFVDRNQRVWFLTKSGGLAIYSPAEDRFIQTIKNPLSAYSLSGDNCTSMFEDKTGIMWIGATGAVNKYDPDKIKFLHITNDPFNPNSLSDKMVRGIYEEPNGDLLIGTDGGFINKYNRVTHQIKRIKVAPDGSGKTSVPMYFHDFNARELLVGTTTGLMVMDKNKYTFTWYKPLKEVFQNRMVRQILRIGDKLYFLSGGNLFIYDLVHGEMTRHGVFSSDPQRRIGNATMLYADSKNRIWLGVQGGVSLLHDDLTFTHYPIEKNPVRPDGSYFMVLTMNEINGNIWIGTFNSGLWQLNPEEADQSTNPIKRIDIPELNASTIYATLTDAQNNVWISTNQGILKLDMQTFALTQFSIGEGVQDQEFNRLSYLIARNGEIVFGGINGVNVFSPAKVSPSYRAVKPVILSVSGFKGLPNEFYVNLRHTNAVSLNHRQNQLSFSYIVPNYQQPVTYGIEYKLEDHDIQWHTASGNTITYNNLKPGKYTFQIRTKFKGEVIESDSLDVSIAHPFWQTWWFTLLAVGFVFVAVYTGAQAYANKARHDKERLEKLLKERTAEIEKSREELEVLNQKKDLIFSILSHDLRSPLTTLKGFLSIIIENVDALPKEAIKKHARSIRNSVSSSLDLIDNTLYWSMSQTGSITYTPSDFSITETLRKIYELYQLTAEKKRINFHLNIPENIAVHGDENMLYVALRNLVSNALKFTREGKNVNLSAIRNHQYAVIKVTDEGIGMDAQYIERLLSDEHLSLKMGTANEKGTGLGLILCKKFVQVNQGELKINSAEGVGTEFTVSLPLSS
ncbi:MAG: hypothetical protein KF725_16800 [Cyclobacteriaceae bacterium]|nr:hypothetical protein [Cyclobacteriaceae bacterium]UYN87638.1 MAG: hypothetical protein KIT51_05095 [Cyclobacteriaceae bacterium]